MRRLAVFFLLLPILAQAASDRVEIGSFRSRAIVSVKDDGKLRPIVILLPGSGANGPEEMIPASYTLDGQDHPLFGEFSAALAAGGWNTLQLGKPGVEFHTDWQPAHLFYDKNLYSNLHWEDLLDNVKNAVDYAERLPGVDPTRIYLLGHSEGTVLAVDYAARDPRVKKILLLGYVGNSLAETVDWQLYRRDLEFFIKPIVDANHDGFVTREEAARQPDFHWTWKDGQTSVSYAEIEAGLRADPDLVKLTNQYEAFPLWRGIFHRPPQFDAAASLTQDIYAFNGTLDTQTRPSEVESLAAACRAHGKANCETTLVPGVGHGFSPPKGPRGNPVLDATIGPPVASFLQTLTSLAERLNGPF